MNELKPCPFCGGIDVEVKEAPLVICGHRYWFIVHRSKGCPLCDAFDQWYSSAKLSTKEKVIEAWNRRAYDATD